MKSISLSHGAGRTRASLTTNSIGKDLVVHLFNEQGHIGAVALADYSHQDNRPSTSVITRLGHKDDSVAYSAAHKLCKRFKQPVCVIAGIHLDDITEAEIAEIMGNCDKLIDELIARLISPAS
jgi:gallate decarboxylase subunit D